MTKKTTGDGVSDTQKRGPDSLSDVVRAKQKSSTPITSDRSDDNGGTDKNSNISNKNLAQDPGTNRLCTTRYSHFVL